ncbi:alpha/beta hydrolase [Roseisolibacter agri]|uniref:Hydrolase n=1 Tax=Roseisolibacter agri TaxID=2014610 RepID=A0AA37QGP8_9BACT|nr:alpha/beta hydrolase [Roseisolibacter agri]GLC28566.1 hydrolase [Roseisolibacter agri]
MRPPDTRGGWRTRAVARAVSALIRRRDWGDEHALVRRARRLFGAPAAYGQLMLRGLRREPLEAPGLRGEWLVPRDTRPGVVLYVHGGGFVSCSPAVYRPLTAALARRTRQRVLALDYRLAPEARFPAALDDAAAAYRWLLDTGVPAGRIAVAGDSAGGGLALSLALRVRDAGWPAPACVVLLSPWTDLTGGGASVRANDGRCDMFRPANMPDFAAVYLGGASPRDPAASPAFAPLHGLPPLLLHVGARELLLDDARRVHDGAIAAGGTSRLVEFEDAFHGWQLLSPWLRDARASLDDVAAFIDAHLPRAS